MQHGKVKWKYDALSIKVKRTSVLSTGQFNVLFRSTSSTHRYCDIITMMKYPSSWSSSTSWYDPHHHVWQAHWRALTPPPGRRTCSNTLLHHQQIELPDTALHNIHLHNTYCTNCLHNIFYKCIAHVPTLPFTTSKLSYHTLYCFEFHCIAFYCKCSNTLPYHWQIGLP